MCAVADPAIGWVLWRTNHLCSLSEKKAPKGSYGLRVHLSFLSEKAAARCFHDCVGISDVKGAVTRNESFWCDAEILQPSSAVAVVAAVVAGLSLPPVCVASTVNRQNRRN